MEIEGKEEQWAGVRVLDNDKLRRKRKNFHNANRCY